MSLAPRCAGDGTFRLAARYWTGGVRFVIGDEEEVAVCVAGGDVVLPPHEAPAPTISLSGPRDVWEKILSPVPPPFFNDVVPALEHGLRLQCSPEEFWQYYPAVQRAVDLLRVERTASA
jgi:hypothetical protein